MSDEARMWTELGRLGEEPLPGEQSDADIVAGALAGLADPASAPVATQVEPARRGPRLAAVTGIVLLAAAAMVLGWWFVPRSGLWDRDTRGSAELAPAVVEQAGAEGRATERTSTRRNTSPKAVPPTPPTPSVMPAADVPAREPTQAELPRTIKTKTTRTATAPSAQKLLERAQQEVSHGKRASAVTSYKQLVARFPHSAEAKVAHVSLGRIELRRGRAKQALAHFDAYLASSAGPLVQEARYGRIRALRGLGRDDQELASITAFLADHTDSLYAARLRKRAQELRTR